MGSDAVHHVSHVAVCESGSLCDWGACSALGGAAAPNSRGAAASPPPGGRSWSHQCHGIDQRDRFQGVSAAWITLTLSARHPCKEEGGQGHSSISQRSSPEPDHQRVGGAWRRTSVNRSRCPDVLGSTDHLLSGAHISPAGTLPYRFGMGYLPVIQDRTLIVTMTLTPKSGPPV